MKLLVAATLISGERLPMLGKIYTKLRSMGLLKFTADLWFESRSLDSKYEEFTSDGTIAINKLSTFWNANLTHEVDPEFEDYILRSLYSTDQKRGEKASRSFS